MDESDLEYSVSVIKRPMRITDKPFIFSTWRNQLYYESAKPVTQPPKMYFKKATEMIKQVLEHAQCTVACLESEPDLIIGYSVSSGPHLHWVYVKKDYRNKGIASLLATEITSCDYDLTKTGNTLAKKKGLHAS